MDAVDDGHQAQYVMVDARCPMCGAPSSSESEVCNACGEPLQAKPFDDEHQSQEPLLIKTMAALALLILFLSVAYTLTTVILNLILRTWNLNP